tara:strand:+ start:773 stop:925 length:153 start_codon:yes stop_codon:yes gene_type:complete
LTRYEPTTEEDHKLVEEFKVKETEFQEEIHKLKQEKDQANQFNLEVQQEW